MGKSKHLICAWLLTLCLLGLQAWKGESAAAESPVRKTSIVVQYTEYQWWLLRWEDNEILCQFATEHEGLPLPDEVYAACGKDVYSQWEATPPCQTVDSSRTCEGLYLHQVSYQSKQREVTIELPPAMVWANLEGCTPTPPKNRCETMPELLLTGEEPLPNERIAAVHGTFDGQPFDCEESTCKIPLRTTPIEGAKIEFWADSSYGDSSEHFAVQVRIVDTGVTSVPGSGGWYVDVMGSQWRGIQVPRCARLWEAFPPIGGPPQWLSTPDQSQLLASDAPYYYLAGRLITGGVVNASDCPSGGMLPNGYADACGLEKARPLVQEWQNQFDARIIDVSKQTGVPAQLMKNLFAQESQFWPGVFRVPFEFGLGQLTDNGVDSVLLWNSTFFDQFCPLVMAQDMCTKGYLHLSDDDKAILRGALALQAKADCSGCPNGIDLDNANFSVALFADMLQASCAQVGQTINTATEHTPGSICSYEDLWRFTVANYHAGPGCLSYAIYSAWQSTGVVNWEQVSARFTEACKGAVPYVEKIAK